MSRLNASDAPDLFSWVPPSETRPPRRRSTAYGIKKDVRIAVRANETRAADRGTVDAVRQRSDGTMMVSYRSDRNGGVYDVALDRVRVLRRPRFRSQPVEDCDG